MSDNKDKASFEELFRQTYVPVEYKVIRNEMRSAAEPGWDLFTQEYQTLGKMNKKTFILYMTGEAYCTFEEIVERAMEELNSEIVDVVSEVSEHTEYDNTITELYFDTLDKTVKEMLDELYDDVLCKLK